MRHVQEPPYCVGRHDANKGRSNRRIRECPILHRRRWTKSPLYIAGTAQSPPAERAESATEASLPFIPLLYLTRPTGSACLP